MYSVRVGWLLTSQMLAPVDCISRVSGSVELFIYFIHTTLYVIRYSYVIPRQTSTVDIGGTSATVE